MSATPKFPPSCSYQHSGVVSGVCSFMKVEGLPSPLMVRLVTVESVKACSNSPPAVDGPANMRNASKGVTSKFSCKTLFCVTVTATGLCSFQLVRATLLLWKVSSFKYSPVVCAYAL